MIGAIADDVTGATDVAVAFRRQGLRTQLIFGVPAAHTELGAIDAVVIALHTRMVDPAEAVTQSVAAREWLRDHGIARTYFKFCSTFDSTPDGNIGPVLDALAEATGARTVVLTPSSPEHGRTQYAGHLFVGDDLLADSPMRHHPVTPMTESKLQTLLRPQTRERIELVPLREVRRGAAAIRDRIDQVQRDGVRFLFTDALTDADLAEIGRAAVDLPLTAGAAGLAGGLAAALAERNPPARHTEPWAEAIPAGRAAVLSGSCSARTLEQVEHLLAAGRPAYFLDVLASPDALAWYDASSGSAAPLIYSSVPPDRLRAIQDSVGTAKAARIIEDATGRVARGLVERGVTRLLMAGGETSGAVIAALGVEGGLVGAEAARGVPWIHLPERRLTVLLKSGNFGKPDLLTLASGETQ